VNQETAKKVAIVVPVIETEPRENIEGFCQSVDWEWFDQDRLHVVYVSRHTGDNPPVIPRAKDAMTWVRSYQCGEDKPRSQMEQCEQGLGFVFRNLPEVEHMVVAASGDLLNPDFIKTLRFALTADDKARVSIPDLAYCDADMGNPEAVRMDPKHTLWKMVQNNMVPDCSMFTRDTYWKLPFEAKYGRSSFWIWWIKMFRRWGGDAFVNVGKPLYHYRFHDKTASSFDEEWVKQGYEQFSAWARAEGLIPPTGSIKPFPKHVWHPKVKPKESP
jgi:hypothetical protein